MFRVATASPLGALPHYLSVLLVVSAVLLCDESAVLLASGASVGARKAEQGGWGVMVGKATETVKAAVCSLFNVVYALLRAAA